MAAVIRNLNLPAPLLSYDKENEAQMRRDLMNWANTLPSNTDEAENLGIHGFGFSAGGPLVSGEILGFGIWPTDIVFTTGDAFTDVVAEGPAAASAVLHIQTWISGVRTTVGTITFAAGASVGTVVWTSSPYGHPASTILGLHAPSPADATLSWLTGRVNGVPA